MSADTSVPQKTEEKCTQTDYACGEEKYTQTDYACNGCACKSCLTFEKVLNGAIQKLDEEMLTALDILYYFHRLIKDIEYLPDLLPQFKTVLSSLVVHQITEVSLWDVEDSTPNRIASLMRKFHKYPSVIRFGIINTVEQLKKGTDQFIYSPAKTISEWNLYCRSQMGLMMKGLCTMYYLNDQLAFESMVNWLQWSSQMGALFQKTSSIEFVAENMRNNVFCWPAEAWNNPKIENQQALCEPQNMKFALLALNTLIFNTFDDISNAIAFLSETPDSTLNRLCVLNVFRSIAILKYATNNLETFSCLVVKDNVDYVAIMSKNWHGIIAVLRVKFEELKSGFKDSYLEGSVLETKKNIRDVEHKDKQLN